MPSVLLYLAIMLVVVVVWFVLMKRPIYEAVLISFIILVAITGTWENIWAYVDAGLSTSLIYSMTAFVAMSLIMTKTKIIDSSVNIILALLGRIPGGAGYASLISSAFMGALSGSGPGNVMATGAITIPAMKRSGFPPELAGNVESNASYMGNMIPPSSNILAALGAFSALYPASNLTEGQFWIVLWGISLWFILQRALTIFFFCLYYKIKPIPKEELPTLSSAIKDGWQGLLLPVVIFLPFLLDYLLKDTLFTARLGEVGAKYLSSSLLLFIPGVVALVTVLIVKDKSKVTVPKIAKMFSDGIKSISAPVGVCIIGYMVGALFKVMNVADEMNSFILSMDLGRLPMVLLICVITCLLGMVIPGSSLVVIFGPVFITVLTSVGVDPVLSAGMLPCICGVMCGITPPLGLGMYAGMSLAESDFTKTVVNNLWWVAGQFIMQVVVLMGWLPIIGL